jgi:Tfp pilus assembly protein PilO
MTHRVRLVLMGIAILLFAVVVWFLVLSPIRGNITTTEQEIQDEQSLVVQANTKLRLAEDTRAEGKRNQTRLLELAKMVPMTEELPSLLLQIQDLADQAGIQFIQVTPGTVTASETGPFQAIPLVVQFTGTYFDVTDFVYRAEQMVAGPGRLLAIKSVDVALGGDATLAAAKSPELQVTMSIYAFVSGGGAATSTPAPPANSGGSTDSSTSTTQAPTGQ